MFSFPPPPLSSTPVCAGSDGGRCLGMEKEEWYTEEEEEKGSRWGWKCDAEKKNNSRRKKSIFKRRTKKFKEGGFASEIFFFFFSPLPHLFLSLLGKKILIEVKIGLTFFSSSPSAEPIFFVVVVNEGFFDPFFLHLFTNFWTIFFPQDASIPFSRIFSSSPFFSTSHYVEKSSFVNSNTSLARLPLTPTPDFSCFPPPHHQRNC